MAMREAQDGSCGAKSSGTAARGAVQGALPPVRSTVQAGLIGLYPASDFRLVRGDCVDCAAPRPALWYFRDDLVAVPQPGVASAGYIAGMTAQDDVRCWHAQAGESELQARPPLVWIGAPAIAQGATLPRSGEQLRLADGSTVRFMVVPKLASNRAYYNERTREFFGQRTLRVRGRIDPDAPGGHALEARTIWPEDYRIDRQDLDLAPLAGGESLDRFVRETGVAGGGNYEVRLLWERNPGAPRDWSGLAALGIMLNGAQGDDDEAHGGHFGFVTGRLGPRGECADWLVNNFYNLDTTSEKGIIASMVPLDNYLMDLNSGQSYYRPSFMIAAVLRKDRAAYICQAAVARVFNHFYRHDFRYRHATANCVGISVDTLRSLGWRIPKRGPTSYVKAIAGYPYTAIRERSLASGRLAFDYMWEERTRLYPAVAFDAAGTDLLSLAGAGPSARLPATAYERLLAEDLEAIVIVRIPQIPSSRAVGTFPVASMDEYLRRVPRDKAQWQIVPVEPRPFPHEFVTADTQTESGRQEEVATGTLGWHAARRRAKRLLGR